MYSRAGPLGRDLIASFTTASRMMEQTEPIPGPPTASITTSTWLIKWIQLATSLGSARIGVTIDSQR